MQTTPADSIITVTRSHKFNDRDHSGGKSPSIDVIPSMAVWPADMHRAETALYDGTHNLPKYFAKSGHADTDPKKVKKNGGGKGNWGHAGDEVEDANFVMSNPRRRSNSSTAASSAAHFKTKFETVEPEPVFEEELHGPLAGSEDMSVDLEKTSTGSSGTSGSVEDEDMADKKV